MHIIFLRMNPQYKQKETIIMTKKILKLLSAISLIAVLVSSVMLPLYAIDTDATLPASAINLEGISATSLRTETNTTVTPMALAASKSYSGLKVYLGGMPFGVKFITKGVLVTGFEDTLASSHSSGLRKNDLITSVNGKAIYSADELNEAVKNSGGKTLSITYTRDGKEHSATLTPTYSKKEGRYVVGIYVRDSGAGIGTVTYIIPKTYEFGGLGHGICDSGTGRPVPMERGSVMDVKISGIVKGAAGTPGEVKGFFSSGKTGTLLKNTDCGVFGFFAGQGCTSGASLVPVGCRDEIKNGEAYIYTMLNDTSVKAYEIEISDIKPDATGNKCFTVKITDKALIAKTGGIIQGMSGSPIIQNGKLVGAVTHVLINDPTTGYGIFIENMLNAAQMPMAKAL